MIAFVRTTTLIARAHLARLLTSKRALFCLLLSLFPAAVALAIASAARRPGPSAVAAHMGWMLELQTIMPLVALIAGSAVVAEEIEDRTITYLFTRPIPRAALLFGRYLSTIVFLLSVFALATFLLLAAASRATGDRGGPIVPAISEPLYAAVLIGVIVYAALFAALGAFFKHPMVVGLGYAFAIEGFLANLPGKNQALTIQYHLRSLIAERGSDAFTRIVGFRTTAFESGARALVVLALVLALALLLGAWRISRRQIELTA
jgi:ABC-type transport system involved in multi-copper enzyme maturation permease subunit